MKRLRSAHFMGLLHIAGCAASNLNALKHHTNTNGIGQEQGYHGTTMGRHMPTQLRPQGGRFWTRWFGNNAKADLASSSGTTSAAGLWGKDRARQCNGKVPLEVGLMMARECQRPQAAPLLEGQADYGFRAWEKEAALYVQHSLRRSPHPKQLHHQSEQLWASVRPATVTNARDFF